MTRLTETESRGSLGCPSAAGREPGWELLLATTAPRGRMGLESPCLVLGITQAPEIGLKEPGPPLLRDCWEQTAAELAVGWHSQADIAGSQRCTKSRGISLEKDGSVLCRSQALVLSEPSAVSTQGSGHSVAVGSSWLLLACFLLPAAAASWP